MSEKLISVKNLEVHFSKQHKNLFSQIFTNNNTKIKAVDGVSLDINQGEILGLVGESGSGKSTLGRAVLQLIKPTSGQVFFEEQNLCNLNHKRLHSIRRNLQIIFQNPHSSLNPQMKVANIIEEPLLIYGIVKTIRKKRVSELISLVHLNKDIATRYPHELSSGQKQRVGIARALALEPKFIVADEPTASLDVLTQIQILKLIMELKRTINFTCLFISHDLHVIRHISNRTAVMYQGKIVEIGNTTDIYTNPQHQYTQTLM